MMGTGIVTGHQEGVERLYQALQTACQFYLPPAACQRVREAFEFAYEAHGDQARQSGEPYITHPLSVALQMAQVYVDEITLIAALLHDVAEDCEHISLDDLEARFGSQVRQLVGGVTHLKDVPQLEDVANLFISMTSDVRVVLIKLYDRLHNMQTLHFLPPDKQRRKAFETLRIYVPLAAKFGIWRVKSELERLILKYIDPAAYEALSEGMDSYRREHLPRLQELEHQIKTILRSYGVLCNTNIEARNLYRIYETSHQRHLDSNSFRRNLRIVIQVDDVSACYLTLGYLHKHFSHLANRLQDNIGNPRDIFYRSIHTTILVPRYSPVDIRIRTYEFDHLSQLGVLAQLQFVPADEEKMPTQATFLPVLKQLFSDIGDPQRFAETVFQDILQKHMVCFTPRGREIHLPRGATVLDFAYCVHTDIGHECRGAVVNGKYVDLGDKLSDGDHVEIIRARRSEPQLEWLDDTLNYATTNLAKRKIREKLKRQSSETLIKQGRDTLQKERRAFNVQNISAQMLAQQFQLDSTSTLFYQIGSGTITISDLVRRLLEYVPDLYETSHRQYVNLVDSLGQVGRLTTMEERGMKLAHCCSPVVGEPIIGYINIKSRKAPIRVHRNNCRHVLCSPNQDNFIQLNWIETTDPLQVVYLLVKGYDRGGLLRDMSIPIAEAGANIAQVDTADAEEGSFTMRLKLEMTNQDQLIRIVHKLDSLQNVTMVQRMTSDEARNWKSSFT